MKITAIIGAIAGNDYNSSGVLKIIYDTMHEIGENINVIDLSAQNLPYFSNSFVHGAFSSIEKEINSSDGIIFITTSNLFAPCAITQNFLEHLSQPVYKNTLKNKNCMIVAISNIQDVSASINYMSMVVNYLGGYDSVKIPLSYATTKNINEDDKILIEKYTEDFYRYVKQNRRFFTPTYASAKNTQQLAQPAGGVFQKPVNNNPVPTPQPEIFQPQPTPVSQQQPAFASQNFGGSPAQTQGQGQGSSLDSFYKAQEDDILEITRTLSDRLSKPQEQQPLMQAPTQAQQKPNNFGVKDIFNNELTSYNVQNLSPTTLNARQMTQNLTHYFQPHLAEGLVCNVELNITGTEAFDGVIVINKNTCEFVDGKANNSDVIISATDEAWKQIVKGTTSTQKAFMTGQIKVRGNFVLLSKFDNLFKI